MLQVSFITENKEAVIKGLEKKRLADARAKVEEVIAVDAVTALPGCVIVTQLVAVQPFASVTVTQYPLAGRPVAVCVTWFPAFASHTNVYGAVPPEPAAIADPVESPKQSTSTVVGIVAVKADGSVIDTVAVVVQPKVLSVTNTVYNRQKAHGLKVKLIASQKMVQKWHEILNY